MIDRVPPHFLDGEKAVLASCLLDNTCIPKVQRILEPNHFYSSNHAAIFAAISSLNAGGVPVDLVTVTENLLAQKLFESIGGSAYLSDLIDACPSTSNVMHYCGIIKEKAFARKVIQEASDIISTCYGQCDPETIREELHRIAFDFAVESRTARGLVHNKDAVGSALSAMEQGIKRGLPSGLLSIDQFTRGFRPGQLVIVGGRPSMGKSALAADISVAAVKKTAVAFFSLEMSNEELVTRFVSKASFIDLHSLRSGFVSQSDWPAIHNAVGELSDYPLFFDDSGTISVAQIKSRIQEITVKTDQEFGLVIIDYLQLLKADGKYNNQNDKISAITRALKRLARDLNTSVVCLSQLNRQLEQRPFRGHERRPRMSDFRDSGSIEQDADIILGIYRPEVYDEDPKYKGQAEAVVLKHRNGPTGIARLQWQPRIATFKDPLQEVEPEQPWQDRETNIGVF